jgi:hypothetical protein
MTGPGEDRRYGVPPLGDPSPPNGPWLVVQILEPLSLSERRRRRHVTVLTEALAAHGIGCTDVHPAVEDPSTLLACCPDIDGESDVRLRSLADLVARRLELASEQAVRIAAYPTLIEAHAVAGDGAA